MSLPINEIVTGDCIEVLRKFPDCCIDEVVTDPPYGIGFMGKNWDKALPSKEAFEQIFRVLKSGGLAFVMSSPRQDVLWRMLKMLEDCGFQLRQSFVSWIYKSGGKLVASCKHENAHWIQELHADGKLYDKECEKQKKCCNKKVKERES